MDAILIVIYSLLDLYIVKSSFSMPFNSIYTSLNIVILFKK